MSMYNDYVMRMIVMMRMRMIICIIVVMMMMDYDASDVYSDNGRCSLLYTGMV